MKDVFDQQHLLISSFVSFLNTAISKQQAGESQVKYNTGLTGWGAPKQPGTPEGSLQKRWCLLLKVKNYASNKAKKKKRAALMARSKKRAASSKSDKSNTSWLQFLGYLLEFRSCAFKRRIRPKKDFSEAGRRCIVSTRGLNPHYCSSWKGSSKIYGTLDNFWIGKIPLHQRSLLKTGLA